MYCQAQSQLQFNSTGLSLFLLSLFTLKIIFPKRYFLHTQSVEYEKSQILGEGIKLDNPMIYENLPAHVQTCSL